MKLWPNWERRSSQTASPTSPIVVDGLVDQLEELLTGISPFSDKFARVCEHTGRRELGHHVTAARCALILAALQTAAVAEQSRMPALLRLIDISDRDVIDVALGSLIWESSVPGRSPEGARVS